MRIISNNYQQPKNLLIKFSNDKYDQSQSLSKCLRERDNDQTKVIELEGNHLTPANANIRDILLDSSRFLTLDSRAYFSNLFLK